MACYPVSTITLHAAGCDMVSQVVQVPYFMWDRVGISGQGLHHDINQRSWLRNELHQLGISFPNRTAA